MADNAANDETLDTDPWSRLPDDGSGLATSDFVTARINRIFRILNRPSFRPYSDVGVLEWRVLGHAASLGPCSARAITDSMSVDKGVISRTLRRLEILGLIDIESDPSDGRATIISLTEAGRAAHARLLPHARRRQASLLQDMSPEERRDLWFLLQKLTATAQRLVEHEEQIYRASHSKNPIE